MGDERPVVAVDLDECLGQFVSQLALWHNDVYGTRYVLNDFDSYHFSQVWGDTTEDSGRKIDAFVQSQYFKDPPIVPGAREVLEALKPQYRFVVVTSRQSAMEAMTKEWLGRHYPGVFDDVLFGNHYGTTGAKMGKPEMCSSIGAVCLIDDSLKYCLQCAPILKRVILFDWDSQYMWNKPTEMPHLDEALTHSDVHAAGGQLHSLHTAERDEAEDRAKHAAHLHGLPPNVIRVTSWAEVPEALAAVS